MLHFARFVRKAAAAAGFSPPPGTYSSDGGTGGDALFTVSNSSSVTWTWSATGQTANLTSDRVSGTAGTSITFTLTNGGGQLDRNVVITLASGANNWTINLTALGNGT